MKRSTQPGWVGAGVPCRIGLLCAALAGLGLCATPAVPAATNTVSAPAGFVRIVVPAGSEALVSPAFVPFDPDINALFEGQLTGATNVDAADAIRQWDAFLQAYTNAYKADLTGDPSKDGLWFTDFSGWTTSALGFHPGEGFWILNRQAATQAVFLCGTVPLDAQGTVTIGPGLGLFGYPFPSPISLNDTRLREEGALGGPDMPDADRVSELIGGSYAQSWLLDDTNSPNHGKWVDPSTNLSETILLPGLGYWYERLSTNAFDWTEPRPYANPFPTNGNPPFVAAMAPNAAKDEITLLIGTSGDPGERLDVYYKDLAASNAFTSLDWQLAAVNLAAGGQSTVTWTDSGSGSRGKINTVHARCYLVGRADVDSDGDGVPDSRETFVYGSNPGASDLTALPFVEDFETNTVHVGDLDGQNRWAAVPAGAALVQTGTVWQGRQALRLDAGTNESAMARHEFVFWGEPVVWVDFRTQATPGAAPTNLSNAAAAFYFDGSGRLTVYDGLRSGTNKWVTLTNQVPADTWVRFTLKLDYAAQEWLVCVAGQVVADHLGFANPTAGLAAFTMTGQNGLADSLRIGTNAPEGVSSDWDGLFDTWELLHFGNLGRDGTGDLDNDGLTDAQEYQLGLDPARADTDGDGLSDGLEVFYGTDPASSNRFSGLAFVEGFETNTVHAGDLNGQNGWMSAPAGMALVQTGTVFQGVQALQLDWGTNSLTTARQLFAPDTNGVAWMDFQTLVVPGAAPTNLANAGAAFYFDDYCRLVAWDGLRSGTNKWTTLTNQAPDGSWARVTLKMDYGAQEWSVYLNGRAAARGLGFASANARGLTAFTVTGQKAFVDALSVTGGRLASVSLDGDSLSDDWEMANFGDLAAGDDGDQDGDGVSNLEEFLGGTDPNSADTDGDGLPDAWELAHGTDPLANDASADPDQDGLTNLQEWQHGTNPFSTDTDDDWMPDTWEIDHGLDPAADDADLDPDGDSLSNLEEYQAGLDPQVADADGDGLPDGVEIKTWHTDPTDPDTDGDGMPDGWEALNGTDPLVSDAALDPDGDQLSNLDEFLAGTDPLDADTDGDGVSDRDELLASFTDPLVADFNGQSSVLCEAGGVAATNLVGTWQAGGDALIGLSGCGSLDYSLAAPSSGVYGVEVEVGQYVVTGTEPGRFLLALQLGGAEVGRQTAVVTGNGFAIVRFFLPRVQAGAVPVRLVWIADPDQGGSLVVNRVRLVDFGGADSDEDGTADWQETRLANLLGAVPPGTNSIVSPVCLEGTASDAGLLGLAADGAPVEVRRALGDAWFANVPLSPTSDTVIAVSVAGEPCAVSNVVRWTAFNPFEAPTNALLIRAGSALKFDAVPQGQSNGWVSVQVVGVTNYATVAGIPVVHAFGSGDYTVRSAFSNAVLSTNREIQVRAIGAAFPYEPACVLGLGRTWTLYGVPAEAAVAADPGLGLSVTRPSSSSAALAFVSHTLAPQRMTLRLGEQGPVLDSTEVQTLAMSSTDEQEISIQQTYDDGRELVAVTVSLGDVPANVTLYTYVIGGGVTLDDGTLQRYVPASEFSESGQYTYYLIRSADAPASFCSVTLLYQVGQRIQ